MIHTIRKLVREIHRRSVWQVLGVYVAMSWVVVNAADIITSFAGLPSWTPMFTLVLLMIGLPMVTATAFIQRGIPGLMIQDEIDPNELPGLTPEQVLVVPEAHPLYGTGIFTWRNAVLGGVGAVTLLAASVVAYLTMWTFGIGPVGSLVAQGVLDTRDPILLAEFENRTDDVALAAAVTDAFRVDLSESQIVTLMDGGSVSDALARMGRDPSETQSAAVVREVAVGEGIKVVVEGQVSRVGSRYLLDARIVHPDDGHSLVHFRESADDDSELLAAIDRLSARVREKAGESLRTIRAADPLEQVTTSSLDALKRFSQAARAEAVGDVQSSIDLLEEALALDSTFAMAWRKLAVQYSNRRSDFDAQVRAATAAYRHRDRLTDRERYLAEAYYHNTVTRDEDAEARAYERVLETHPRDPVALNKLSLIVAGGEDWERAVALQSRAVTGPGPSRSAYSNLVISLYNVGKADSALAVLDEWEDRYPTEFGMAQRRFQLLWALGDTPGAMAAARSGLERFEGPLAQYGLHLWLGQLAHAQGRMQDATTEFEAARAVAEKLGAMPMVFEAAAENGWSRAQVGLRDTTATLRDLERLLETVFPEVPESNRPYSFMGYLWAHLAGNSERARYWWDQADRVGPADMRGRDHETELLRRRALLALVDGDFETSLDILDEVARQRPCQYCLLVDRAYALQGVGRADEAVEALAGWLGQATFDSTGDVQRQGITHLPVLAGWYEELSRNEEARDAWTRFADQLQNADAVLQPRVAEARRRAEALGGERG